jgi:hypothetical protein
MRATPGPKDMMTSLGWLGRLLDVNRDAIHGMGAVGLVVGFVAVLATALGQSDFGFPLAALAYWLAVIIVVRPYVYERFGNEVGDWTVVILVLGPAILLAAPFLWLQHRRLADNH